MPKPTKRAKPDSPAAQLAAKRWQGTTSAERSAHAKHMNAARWKGHQKKPRKTGP